VSAFLTLQIKVGIANCPPTRRSRLQRKMLTARYTCRTSNTVWGAAVIEDTMSCRSCSSENEAEFTAEIMIHFSGRRHLVNPGVLAFSKILVCLDCGSARFAILESDLALLNEGLEPSTAA
jgi:hypothetical protein